jgi:hypothetical protein
VAGKNSSVLKFTYGRFVPEQSLVGDFDKNGSFTTDYCWHDLNGDRRYQPGEVDLSTAPGAPDFISTTSPANNILNPNVKLPYVQVTVAFEQELSPSTAVRGLYLRRINKSQTASVNVLRPYSAFNIPITRTDPGRDGCLATRTMEDRSRFGITTRLSVERVPRQSGDQSARRQGRLQPGVRSGLELADVEPLAGELIVHAE